MDFSMTTREFTVLEKSHAISCDLYRLHDINILFPVTNEYSQGRRYCFWTTKLIIRIWRFRETSGFKRTFSFEI